MWQRFTLYDLRVIGHYLGSLIMFSSLLMLPPFLLALIFQEWEPAGRYLLAMGIPFVAGAAMRFLRIEPGKLTRRQALVVTGLAWIVIAFFCSIPLYLSGHYVNYYDALFDGVSGITTTGATVIVDLDHLSNADNMFRFMMHLLGGLGLIVLALSIGLFGKEGGSALYSLEGRSEHVVPNVVQTARFIGRITALVIIVATILLAGLCFFAGMRPVRAVLNAFWIAISGFVTGGFTPMSQSIMYYHSFPIEVVLMILMVMGSVSFVIYAEVWKGRAIVFLKDFETKTMFIWVGVMVLVFTAALCMGSLFSDLPDILRRGLFLVISSFTTTGFQTVTSNQLVTVFSSGAFLVLALVMAIGGGAGSTAGGIKLSRIGIVFISIANTIKEAIAPDSARVVVAYNHLGRRVLTPEVVKEAMTVSILYLLTFIIGSLVGIAHGYDATQAIFESVAMASNGGIVSGIAAPGMPATLETCYLLEMWAGRLEFVAFLGLMVNIMVSLIPRPRKKRL